MDRNLVDTLRAAVALAAAPQDRAANSDSESESRPPTPTSSKAGPPGDDGQLKEDIEKTKRSILKRSEDVSDEFLKKGAPMPGFEDPMPDLGDPMLQLYSAARRKKFLKKGAPMPSLGDPMLQLYSASRDKFLKKAATISGLGDPMRQLYSARRKRFLKKETRFARNGFPRPDITNETNISLCRKGLPVVMYLHQLFVEHDDPVDDVGLEFVDVMLDGAQFLCEDGYRPEAVPLLQTADCVCSAKLPQQRLEVKKLYPDVLRLLSIYECFEGIKGRQKASIRIGVALMMQTGSEILHHPAFEAVAGVSKGDKKQDLTTKHLLTLFETARLYNQPPDTINNAKERKSEGLGADHGRVSMQQDETQDAESLFMTAFRIWGHNFIPMHISYVFLKYGQRGTARASLGGGIKHLVTILGPDSHHTLWFKFLKAVFLLNTGDLDASFALHKEVYEARRTKLGEAHHETLSSRYHVAVGYHLTGILGVAEEHLRQILEHSTTSLQWREEDLARASFRLSLILKQQDKVEEAVEFAKKARDMQSKWAGIIPKEVGQEFSDSMAEMARFDFGVYQWHGRAVGGWNVGEYW